ncbi:hypothetical protein H0A58_08990 [Alcaligenaceae bacterium]|nr:hypothetical protein [Alcaligenaceae bacterium]
MNRFDLQKYLQQELQPYQSNFYDTSFDKENKKYLCSDQTTENVYDFDRYIAEKHDGINLPASPDAIFIGKKDLYFVEFKNQYVKDIESAQIKRKFKKGTEILRNMLKDFTPKDCRYHFCVVFRKDKNYRYFNFNHIEKSSVRFGLDDINKEQGQFYDQIITEDIAFFSSQFTQLKCVG